MFRLLLIPVTLVILLGIVVVWSTEDDPRPADFTFINRGEINTLDPNQMSWLQDIRVGYALWEGLYTLHPETLEAVPGAAGEIDVSEDGRVYTFHIRPDARWSNGDPLVAGDFVFAWRRMLEQPGYYTYLLHYVEGTQAYQNAFAENGEGDFDAVGIEILDDKTLRVRLTEPAAFFPDLCAFPPFFPLHEASMAPFAYEDREGRTRYAAGFTRAGNLVGNGPYRLESWEFKRRMRMVASEYYWDHENVHSEIIDMLSFEDLQAAFLKYEGGGVDWLAAVGSELAAELLEAGREDLRVFPGFGTYYYSINCKPTLPDGRENPFADERVRQALAMSIDKRPIVETITRLGEPIAGTYVPAYAFPDYDSVEGLPYDPDRARELLAEAGYPGGQGFPRVTLTFNTDGDHQYIAQMVRGQWREKLGVQVELQGVEVGTFRHILGNIQYDIARASWIGDYNDPSTFTDKYLSTSQNNTAGWVNEEYDRLCAEAARETDPERRIELLRQAEQIFVTEAAVIPVYYYVNAYLFRDNVHGVPLHPRNMIIFKSVSVER